MSATLRKRTWLLAGFTLLEALLASAVLAMAVAAITMPFAAGAQNVLHDARTTLAVNLAEEMMEEILCRPHSDPNGSETGESGRGTWDDIQDYANYCENAGQIFASTGQRVTDGAATGLSRHVTVQSVYVTGQDTSQPPCFLRLTVQVRYHGRAIVTLTRLVYTNE